MTHVWKHPGKGYPPKALSCEVCRVMKGEIYTKECGGKSEADLYPNAPILNIGKHIWVKLVVVK